METGNTEALIKPDRYPDLVTSWGGCFWWPEMVYMSRDNELFQLSIEEGGQIKARQPGASSERELPHYTKEYYDKWWYETFESKFLGEESDE